MGAQMLPEAVFDALRRNFGAESAIFVPDMKTIKLKLRHAAALILLAMGASASAGVFDSLPDSTYRYSVTLNGSASSGAHTPFWLVNNHQGLSSLKKDNGYLRAALFREADSTRTWSWRFGVDMAVAAHYESTFNVQQLYAGVNWRWLSLTIGSKERHAYLGDWRLSSGDLLFSENSRPIPQARLEVENFVAIPGTKGWLAAKGYISLGAFTDTHWLDDYVPATSRVARNVLFHSKGLFFRIGDPKRYQLSFEGGLEMGAQWGGSIRRYDAATGKYSYSKMGHSLRDLWHVIIPASGGDPTDPTQGGEIANCYGNHTGQWSAGLNWLPTYTEWGVKAYYKHFFEDHSMMTFDYPWRDMLLGAEVLIPSNPVISKFVYEYLYSKFQGSSVYWDITDAIHSQISGRDNYYNHSIYNGWQHWGMGIGNPILRSPIYNEDHEMIFYHNRVIAHHFGLTGSPMAGLDYRALFTYTRSWGTYSNPTRNVVSSFNMLAELTWRPARLKGWSGTLSVGADWGKLTGRSSGVMLSISKSGWL